MTTYAVFIYFQSYSSLKGMDLIKRKLEAQGSVWNKGFQIREEMTKEI